MKRRILTAFSIANVAFAAFPLVDFDRMGKVGLAGAFAGLDLFQNSSVAFDSATSTLFSRSEDGALSRIAATNPGGKIVAGCVLNNLFYLAGEFTTIGSTSASNIASYDPSSGALSAVGSNGPNGAVDAVYCDDKNNRLWAGGSFKSPGSAIAVWDPSQNSWSQPPFSGVSGASARVFSITANEAHSSLFFGGSFVASFQGNGGVVNGNNNPSVPASSGASPFSFSLVPVPLEKAETQGSRSSDDRRFNSISNALCPSGDDGTEGNTWLGANANTAVITARAFSFISAGGIRLGNTFVENHGTTGFSLTTIPDNAVRTLRYVDPQTRENKTCTNPCPLSTDSSIPYQDFLFDDTLTITGIIITISEWRGDGPGLHLLQLLSSGAFASSVDALNAKSCFAPKASSSSRVGDWSALEVDTGIPATTQTVLVASADAGKPPSEAPSFTWMPYVSAFGDYEVNMLIPGCTRLANCDSRTSVKVTVFPGNGIDPVIKTISQKNTDDATALIYRGPILPSTPDFVTTITMTLADNPEGKGKNGKYELIADRIALDLKTPASSNGDGGNGLPTGSGSRNALGFLEWPFNHPVHDATKVLPNATETSADSIGFSIFQAGGSSTVRTVAHHSDGTIFVGGSFSIASGDASGAKNIVTFKNGKVSKLGGDGLDGTINAMLIEGSSLYVAGTFRDTASKSNGGSLRNVAVYNIEKSEWTSLGFGVNGPVNSLAFANGHLQLAGNFTTLLESSSSDEGYSTSGLAVWSPSSQGWVNNGGFLVGGLTFIGNGASSSQFIAGNIAASQAFGASGMVMLKNGGGDKPNITPLRLQLNAGSFSPSSPSSRRSLVARTPSWIPQLSQLWSRQESPQPAALPSPPQTPAPSVLAGTFWRNGSADEVVIIGGNFSFLPTGARLGSEEYQGLAVYDQAAAKLTSLAGAQINGTVRALLVQGNLLYVGGEFSVPNTDVNGFAVYDLANSKWDVNGIQALRPSSGSSVIVRSITKSNSRPNTIVVAGSFLQAGELRCEAICSLDTTLKQWNVLGSGIRGEVAAVTFAGNNQDLLLASGSIALSDSTAANVAQFALGNNTWAAVGKGSDIPGPATAIEVNNGNSSSIFAAGKSGDGSPYLVFWNGVNWTRLPSAFNGSSSVAQLVMVPLRDTHEGGAMIEADRMLMISGILEDSSFGTTSTALFDGRTFIPYITSTSSSGTAGVISSLFHSFTTFSFNKRKFLAVGIVILISIAIAAGIVFLLTLIGILWTLFSRREDKLNKTDLADEDDDDSTHHRPSSLLEHINAATRTTILGGGAFAAYNPEKEEEKAATDAPYSPNEQDPFAPDASNYLRAETPSDAMGGVMGEDASRPAHARYSFDGTGEGELPLSAGAEVEVLDDRDAAWWYARDVRTGREGVVPAAYLY